MRETKPKQTGMRKYDLHVHSIHSPDSATPVEKLVDRYASLGFAGFALTDHKNMDGAKRARAYIRQKRLPLEFVAGCEFRVGEGEIIGLFIDEAPQAKDAGELVDDIHSMGGLAIVPHPFDKLRKSACDPTRLPSEVVSRLDGIELFNARCHSAVPNEKSAAFAKVHSLAQTGGSDAHFLFEAGAAYTLVPGGMELEAALRKRKTSSAGSLSPIFVHGPTTLVKMAKRWGWIKTPKQ